MPIYLCRWPNGEFSIVSASNRTEAIEQLDEWGNAEQAELSRIGSCMFDFRLSDDGDIELAHVGERTYGVIMDKCYPVLKQAIEAAEPDEANAHSSESGSDAIEKAVEVERERLWGDQPPPKEPETDLGRKIQRLTDAPRTIVNRAVRRGARRVLESDAGERGKPN
jgi:hypothetical protein